MFEVLRSTLDALINNKSHYFKSIFGEPASWTDEDKFSEFNMASSNLLKLVKYTSEVALPPLLGGNYFLKPFIPSFLQSILFVENASILEIKTREDNRFEEEKWFFINGVATNEDLASSNGKYISLLFQRPVTVLHNPTNGIGLDILQSATGKFGSNNIDFANFVLPKIRKALQEREKILIISHSQGTLITSTILELLIKENNKNLGKLEIYAFANCATEMSYQTVEDENNRPWIESFSNQHDLIAQLGAYNPNKKERGIKIDGEHFIKKNAWGHFLNIHYLKGFVEGDYQNEDGSNKKPRLYGYLKGKK